MIELLPDSAKPEKNLPLVNQQGSKRSPRQSAVSSLLSSFIKKIPSGWAGVRLIGVSLLAAGMLAGVGEYIVFPQLSARWLAKDLYPSFVTFRSSLEDVNDRVGTLFTLVTGEEQAEPQVSFNLPDIYRSLRDKVAGEKTKFGFYDFLSQARSGLVLVSASFSSNSAFGVGSRVAGAKIIPIESQVTDDLRVVMEAARVCGTTASASKDRLLLLSSSLPQRFPRPLGDLESGVDSFVQDSTVYLDEASKAARYYEVVTDVQIDLVPATISLVNLVQDLYIVSDPTVYSGVINTLMSTVNGLAQRLEELSDSLPLGIERLHEDNIGVFTLFTQLLDETKSAVADNDFARFDEAVAQFETELEVLATRAKTYELSFWQKTPLLKDYVFLLAFIDQAEEGLNKFR